MNDEVKAGILEEALRTLLEAVHTMGHDEFHSFAKKYLTLLDMIFDIGRPEKDD